MHRPRKTHIHRLHAVLSFKSRRSQSCEIVPIAGRQTAWLPTAIRLSDLSRLTNTSLVHSENVLVSNECNPQTLETIREVIPAV